MQDLLKYKRMCYGDRKLLVRALEPENWARFVVSVAELCTRPISQLQIVSTEIFFSGLWGYGMQDWHLVDNRADKAIKSIAKKYNMPALKDFEILDKYLESLNVL